MKVLLNGTKFLELKSHPFDFLPAFAKAVQEIKPHLLSHYVAKAVATVVPQQNHPEPTA